MFLDASADQKKWFPQQTWNDGWLRVKNIKLNGKWSFSLVEGGRGIRVPRVNCCFVLDSVGHALSAHVLAFRQPPKPLSCYGKKNRVRTSSRSNNQFTTSKSPRERKNTYTHTHTHNRRPILFTPRLDANGPLSHLHVAHRLGDVVPLGLARGDEVALPELHGLADEAKASAETREAGPRNNQSLWFPSREPCSCSHSLLSSSKWILPVQKNVAQKRVLIETERTERGYWS